MVLAFIFKKKSFRKYFYINKKLYHLVHKLIIYKKIKSVFKNILQLSHFYIFKLAYSEKKQEPGKLW